MLFMTGFFAIASILLPGIRASRILGVFAHNGRSHFLMNEQLLKGLAKRGHQVDVVSHFPLKKPFPNYNQIIDLTGTIPYLENNLTYGSIRASVSASGIPFLAATSGGVLCDLMDQPRFRELIENPPTDPPYDLVIVNILGASCYLALGQHLKVPVATTVASVLWPWANDMVANPDNPAYIPGVFSGLSGRMNFWQRMGNALQLMSDKWQFDYYSAYQDEKIKKYIGPHALSLREAERNVSLILTNSHYSLNGVRPYTAAVVEVGGLHIPENVEELPKDLEKWLNDSEDGFVYIAFGSMLKLESFPKETLEALYTSIAKLSPVRVLMKISKPEELPPGLPSNVLIKSWIPQLAVLKHKHARVFMTHGGLMGTQEAVYCGVPMIGLPVFSDQPQNMKLYVGKKVAVSLDHEQLTVEKFDDAFNALLHDPSYKTAAKRLSAEFRDRPMSPLDTAVFWVEYVIRHGGMNIRSPAMDLTWWQIALLDVYGVLLSAVVFVTWSLVFLIKKLTRAGSRNLEKEPSSKKFE